MKEFQIRQQTISGKFKKEALSPYLKNIKFLNHREGTQRISDQQQNLAKHIEKTQKQHFSRDLRQNYLREQLIIKARFGILRNIKMQAGKQESLKAETLLKMMHSEAYPILQAVEAFPKIRKIAYQLHCSINQHLEFDYRINKTQLSFYQQQKSFRYYFKLNKKLTIPKNMSELLVFSNSLKLKINYKILQLSGVFNPAFMSQIQSNRKIGLVPIGKINQSATKTFRIHNSLILLHFK